MRNKANILDLIKVVACVLIVGSHCLPLFRNDGLNYYYGQWFFRFCVPLFFCLNRLFLCEDGSSEKKSIYQANRFTLFGCVIAILSVVF